MRSFDFLSAVIACVVTLSAGYFALRALGLRLSIRLERRGDQSPQSGDDVGEHPG